VLLQKLMLQLKLVKLAGLHLAKVLLHEQHVRSSHACQCRFRRRCHWRSHNRCDWRNRRSRCN